MKFDTISLSALASVASAQSNVPFVANQSDPGLLADTQRAGPTPELVHLFYDLWPTGICTPFHYNIYIVLSYWVHLEADHLS